MKFGTKAIHAGQRPDPSTGAIITPIHQTSTFVQESPGVHKGFTYARTGNPTRSALEGNIAALENGKHGLCFASGLSAIDAVLKLFKPGDEIISCHDLYGGTYRIFKQVFEKYGIAFHFVPMDEPAEIQSKINANTRLIWLETPTNPMINIHDITKVASMAKSKGVLLVVDNTFATPYLQTPLDLGADIVLHSATKYLGGHSDVIMGALVVNDRELYTQLAFIQGACGAVPGPNDCFLVLRGIKTLHLRMDRHCENAEKIALFLKSHPKVDKVHWPGFEDHPGHQIAKRQMKDFGGMISFSLNNDTQKEAFEVMEKTKIFSLAESLGGVESLIGHPATMSHASIPKAEREAIGITESLIRLSVGVEDAEDLIEDLKQSLE